MFAKTTNPRFPGAPAWMSDGRLFTDYRPNCRMLAPLPKGQAIDADLLRKQQMQRTGIYAIAGDRSMTVLRAGSQGCVDTMVPELSKRVCGWDGCTTLPAHSIGIGQGRLYLPGRPGLATADPDTVAAMTFPMAGTFSANPTLYMPNNNTATVSRAQLAVPARPNRYSAPYGN